MRNVFEWLMTSKFSSISEDFSIIEKWHNDETIYFSNSILKKIKQPAFKLFYDFWSLLCEYSHATRISMQVLLNLEKAEDYDDIFFNLRIVNFLLECNYHLLNTHLITPEYDYLGKFYFQRKFINAASGASIDQLKYKVSDLRILNKISFCD
jgi:hypothetical protein